jgi:hypothetical protein
MKVLIVLIKYFCKELFRLIDVMEKKEGEQDKFTDVRCFKGVNVIWHFIPGSFIAAEKK